MSQAPALRPIPWHVRIAAGNPFVTLEYPPFTGHSLSEVLFTATQQVLLDFQRSIEPSQRDEAYKKARVEIMGRVLATFAPDSWEKVFEIMRTVAVNVQAEWHKAEERRDRELGIV